MRHPLTDDYQQEREMLLTLGRGLSDAQAAKRTEACPAWSVKDIYAHLAGISTDIVNDNTEGAATPEWADGHVAARAEDGLEAILDEWTIAGAQVSETMEHFGSAFPFQLFLDQWTHAWDIRSALGPEAAAEPDTSTFDHYLDDLLDTIAKSAVERGVACLTYQVAGRRRDAGVGEPVGTLALSSFEFARACMGRRSRNQLVAWPWPVAPSDDFVDGHIEALVFWSVAETDIIDPLR